MKKLKKLTRKQKELLKANGLEPSEYLLGRQDDKNKIYTLVHIETKEKLELCYE